ncbi:MAG: hypothetical protein U9P50_01735 [Patescibacteria group bacterium]|nr:hypothetical protein [Patescibacteria group bacterium]
MTKPIKHDPEMLTREQVIKEFIEELLPELYSIRANIPLTNGMNSRKQVKKLIDKLERRIK